MLRLKANKTSLYRLVRQYEKLPKMNKTEFKKAPRQPDYWLEWFDGDFCKAFFAGRCGQAVLIVTKQDGSLHEHTESRQVHRLSIEDLRERGMIEETAAT